MNIEKSFFPEKNRLIIVFSWKRRDKLQILKYIQISYIPHAKSHSQYFFTAEDVDHFLYRFFFYSPVG